MKENNQKNANVIQLNTTESKAQVTSKKARKKGKKKSKKVAVTFGSEPRTLALKFYPEQLLDEKSRIQFMKCDDVTRQRWIDQLTKVFLQQIKQFRYLDFQVAVILHDSDKVKAADDPFAISIEKAHFHLIIRRLSKKRFRVNRIIQLLGLYYIKDDNFDDTIMWNNGGAEIIRDFASYFLYLSHETNQAIVDGKHKYDRSEVISNFGDEIREALWQAGLRNQKKSKIDWDEINDIAYTMGLNLKDFDPWVKANLTVTDQANKNFRVVSKSYQQGLSEGVAKVGHITRCSILIHGKGNLGKSYTALESLKALHLNVYRASKGSGKYDNLSTSTDAMIFDDVAVSDARNVFDNLAVTLHRRNSNDRAWLGNYAVVTTNDDPETFCRKMAGVNSTDELLDVNDPYTRSKIDAINAIKQRLYICTIKNNKLIVESATTRGSRADAEEHDKLFKKFAEKFNAILKNYKPEKQENALGDALFRRAYETYERLGKDYLDEETLARALTYELALQKNITNHHLDVVRKDNDNFTKEFFENINAFGADVTENFVGYSLDLASEFQNKYDVRLTNMVTEK